MFYEKLKESAQKTGSIVCLGCDPLIEKIPLPETNVEKRISQFYSDILDACVAENVLPGAIKPNYAFYAQYGFQGLHALDNVIKKANALGIPVIFDGKRGDIGKTSEAYAKEAFEFWNADALTVAPYMGTDSVAPFAKWCEKGRGIYVLVRTSNKGAVDFQNQKIGEHELFLEVAKKVVEWSEGNANGVGAVVGATSMPELEKIAHYFAKQKNKVPLLIPGVGAQGGSAKEVVAVLKNAGYDMGCVRINSSSGINYAYEEEKSNDYAGAAVRALKKLNAEIGKI